MKTKENNTNNNTRLQLYWNTLLRIPCQGISFVISILVARILVPEDFGIQGIVMMTIFYTNLITNFGFNEALIQKKIRDMKSINSIFTVDFLISSIFVGILFIASGNIAAFFNIPECKDVIKVASSIFIITTFNGIPKAILRRNMNFKTVSIMDAIQALLAGILTLILAMNHFKYWSLVYGQIIPLLIVTILLCIKTKWIPIFYYNHSSMKQVYEFGMWNFLKTQVQFISQYTDRVIIGRFLGPVSLGLYEKAMSIAVTPLQSLTMNINAVMFSSFSNNQENKTELQNQFKKTLTIISVMNMPIFAGLIVIAPFFVYVLLGDKWAPMIKPFQIILFACIFKSFGGLSSSLNVAMGNYKKHTFLSSLSSVLFVLLCFFLLKFELIGISISFLFYCAVLVFLTMSLAIRKIDVSWKNVISSFFPGMLGSTIMFFSVKVLSLCCFKEYSFQNTAILISVGITTYVSYLFISRSNVICELRSNILADITNRLQFFQVKGRTLDT